MTVRVAMVGAGSVATRHVRVLSGFPDATVVAVADPDRPAAERLAADCGAVAYTDAETLLERERVDAVYVCVPPVAHGQPERAALARRLPLFVEKPIAADLPTAAALAAEVAAAGVVTGTGYHWRCLDTVDRARALLADRPARLAQGYWLDTVPPPAWWVSRERSGGQVIEQLTHVVDLARALVGEIETVYAQAARTDDAWVGRAGADIDDVTAAAVRYRGGAIGTFAASCLLPRPHLTELQLVSPGLVLQLSERELVVDAGGGRQAYQPAVDGRVQVDRDFLDALTGRRQATRAPYAEAMASHRVGCAIVASAAGGRAVRLGRPDTGS
jgi:predicted dehydrogenase